MRDEILTHREIAKRLGISHGRVQQLERQALLKMRILSELLEKEVKAKP